ncbi:DNA methyltransferase [endosymbiont GvMRE of Glomus versiforme]|nr:DNA methyltransferase [endosymbiont GvMRE of Glomus versiforme]
MKFMLPGLIIMREMLKKNGILAICIDYRELFNLGKMFEFNCWCKILYYCLKW